MIRVLRASVPYLLLPLSLVASLLCAAPWLRSFPTSVAAVPLYGAAVLSVLVPVVVVQLRPRWLWLSTLVDLVAFVVYALLVVLHSPGGFVALWNGLYQGPSQILTFALPLVSPRSLMIGPVALVWLAGALAGECVARRWYTVLPYLGFLASFGLAYAGTERAAGSSHLRETLLAAGLLATLLLMRAAQAWLNQEQSAETTQADGVLPLRGLVVGVATTVVLAVLAAAVVQVDAFPKRSTTPQRVPTVNNSKPLAPLAFVAGLRPRTGKDRPRTVFTVATDQASAGYFAIANVDYYDGSGWSFDRTFRPSGGVLPADTDTALRTGAGVTQHYRLDGPLAGTPWMPFLYRPQKVSGASVNIDQGSGMIVPAGKLGDGTTYTVRSTVPGKTYDALKVASLSPDTATPTIDSQIPGNLRTTLDEVVKTFTDETGVPSTPALPFLQALQSDLRSKYTLSGAAQGSASGTSTSTATPGASTSPTGSGTSATGTAGSSGSKTPRDLDEAPVDAKPKSKHKSKSHSSTHPATKTPAKKTPASSTSAARPTTAPASATPSGSSSSSAADLAGSTGFADVIASIVGPGRSGTPEQFATLVALVARDLGVPARVVTGFRVRPADNSRTLPAGRYDVTTEQAWTWTEIPVVGSGWVVLDAAPGKYTQDKQQSQSAQALPPPTTAQPSQNPLVTDANNGHAVAPKSRIPSTSSATNRALLIALIVAIGLLVLAMALILLSRKSVRAARRRRSPDPRTRLIGAWQESLDVLSEAGLPELTALTSVEIADLTRDQFGAEPGAQAATLGTAANNVAYTNTIAVAPEQAEQAWQAHRLLRRSVYRQLGFGGRLAAGLRYHRPKQGVRPTSPSSWAESAAASLSETARRSAADSSRRRRYRGRRRRAH